MNISLLNVPPETPDHLLTDYLNSYADIQGAPLHVKKSHDGIDYSTGTRVYQITRLYQHTPRQQAMFGRIIVCIYDEQPEEKTRQANRKRHKMKQQQQRQYRYHSPDNTDDLDD